MQKSLGTDKPPRLDNCADRLSLRIADITMAISSAEPELKLQLEGAKNKFLIDEAEPDVRIRAVWSELSEEPRGEKLFDSGSSWQLYYQDGAYLFCFTPLFLGSRPFKMAFFNQDFTQGEVYLHRSFFKPGQFVDPLGCPLDELLTINFLAKGRGAEIHACGVMDSFAQGNLFVGQSGAGKSTMARLWGNEPGVTILSDDRIVLRKMGNTIWMYGTPWHGEAGLASPEKAQLVGIYFLRHGKENKLIPKKPADSVGRLFACSFPPFYSGEGIDFTLGFLENVVKNVPCYELRFLPDKSVVEFIQEERFT